MNPSFQLAYYQACLWSPFIAGNKKRIILDDIYENEVPAECFIHLTAWLVFSFTTPILQMRKLKLSSLSEVT